MKQTFAIAALLSVVSAYEQTEAIFPVWNLRSVKEHDEDQKAQIEYAKHSIKQANERKPYSKVDELQNLQYIQQSESSGSSSSDDTTDDDEDIQVRGDVDHSGERFRVGDDGMVDGAGYSRVTPSRFSADSDDIFMRSMIEQYAVEGKTKGGEPSGAFFMNKTTTYAAAQEVLATHKGLTGGALQKYLDTYFEKSFNHFDVNLTGELEVIKMPQFMRFLASDQYMQLGESG